MFDNLTSRLGKSLKTLFGKGKLTESNIQEGLKEVRQALLSADVHFRVVQDFIRKVKEQCLGQEVLSSVTPDQQVIKIIHDELVVLLGGEALPLPSQKPLSVLMIGLHGSGKTTCSGKLARLLKEKAGYTPALIGCDVYRPAAMDQLKILADQVGAFFYTEADSKNPVKIAQNGLKAAKEAGADLLIFDTAGRLQIDTDLVEELKQIQAQVKATERFLVGDIALGQEAVSVATHFHEAMDLTGIILTKLDGDARGGAALSMKSMANVPIRFMGYGEKVSDFDVFYPDRLASRILGMGDVVSLVEKLQESVSEEEARKAKERLDAGQFNLEDMLQQFKQLDRMGSVSGFAKMMPGMGDVELGPEHEDKLKRSRAILLSMRPDERRHPQLLSHAGRRMRIANGSGTLLKDVNALLKQYQQMRKMMTQLKGSKFNKLMKKMGGKFPGFGA